MERFGWKPRNGQHFSEPRVTHFQRGDVSIFCQVYVPPSYYRRFYVFTLTLAKKKLEGRKQKSKRRRETRRNVWVYGETEKNRGASNGETREEKQKIYQKPGGVQRVWAWNVAVLHSIPLKHNTEISFRFWTNLNWTGLVYSWIYGAVCGWKSNLWAAGFLPGTVSRKCGCWCDLRSRPKDTFLRRFPRCMSARGCGLLMFEDVCEIPGIWRFRRFEFPSNRFLSSSGF